MKRARRVPLNVFMGQRRIGTLTKKSNGGLTFRYADEWMDAGRQGLVSYSLPVSKKTWSGDPVEFVFENLLPDNRPIREAIASKKHAAGSDAFSLLSVIGRDCVGALQFLPEGEAPHDPAALEYKKVSDRDVAKILTNLAQDPLGMNDDNDDFRLSIAGAQEKTALLRRDDTWNVPYGTTPTTHIFKTPMPLRADGVDLRQSCENEHFCMTFLRNLDMKAADTELATFEDQKAIIITRFDRGSNDGVLQRRHQEDMCQALSLPSSMKYEKDGGIGIPDIMKLLLASETPTADREAFMKAQVVYWLLGASDGHAKNYSIFLPPTGGFRMTPLYDVMSLQPIIDAGQLPERRLRVALSVGKKKHYGVPEITPRHFSETAEICNFSNKALEDIFQSIIDTTHSAMDKTMTEMPKSFPEQLASSIANGAKGRVEIMKAVLAG